MATFLEILYRIEEENETLPDKVANTTGGAGDTPLLNSGEETKAMEVIRIGKNIDKNIWNNLAKLCNNNEGLAELLGVKSEQIATWASKIYENLKKVDAADSQKKRNKMVATGNNGPMARVNNDEGPVTYPNDTNPTP